MWANWTPDFLPQIECFTILVNFTTTPPVPPVANTVFCHPSHWSHQKFYRCCLQNAPPPPHPLRTTSSLQHRDPAANTGVSSLLPIALPPLTLVLIALANFLLRSQRRDKSKTILQCKSEPAPLHANPAPVAAHPFHGPWGLQGLVPT